MIWDNKLFLCISALIFMLLCTEWLHSSHLEEGAPSQSQSYEQPFDTVPLVSVHVAGKYYNFLLDSGVPVVLLDRQLARQVTVPLDTRTLVDKTVYQDLTKLQGTRGAVDPSRFDLIKPVALKLGSFSLVGQDVWVSTDLSPLSEAIGVQVSGILGVDTFRQFSWDVSNEKKVIQITQRPLEVSAFDECIGYSDKYGSQPELLLAMGEQQVLMPIDTGASRSYIAKELVDHLSTEKGALQVNPGMDVVANANGISELSRYVVNAVTLNNQPLGMMEVHEVPDRYGAGMDVLSRFSRYAFIPSKMMFCYSGLKPVDPLPLAYRDIRIKVRDGQITLDYNTVDQLRESSLLNGDVIKQVNGQVYVPRQIETVRNLLKTTPPGKLNLHILRSHQVMQVDL
ncbi:pepsin/retropepsin-like aspartic protease family protein [Pseudomonas sp. MH2]|uniref:Pepsin/retropepsin-like aspartic protease family protein n=1 Tax=Pseudomonas machongensis TaxID=3110229 RepID=A0ABU5VK46_9PSED|nr:pepsin/retropepsin-like aspartic protease family protein [Pseudomonas sp. MH2]MEA5673696.1 pepsin/retropepsin-like aspartic protease family protein [Pseudomonas sp. MH2]